MTFNALVCTRRERANRVRLEESAFFEQYTGRVREILLILVEKYAEHGTTQFSLEVLKVPPLSNFGIIGGSRGCLAGQIGSNLLVEQLLM
jgi:type I restriction enzyme R subunit